MGEKRLSVAYLQLSLISIMALTERHRWCISKILESFEGELNSEAVNTFMRQEAVALKFAQFFAGESSGRLFVFFQPEITEDGVSKRHLKLGQTKCLEQARFL